MTIELTRELARFAAGVRYENLPERAVLAARLGFTDCVGVMIAGAAEESPRRLSAFVSPVGTGPSAPEIPSGRAVSPGDAALVNGTAAHVLDYDDVAINGHTSAVIVPALLAWGWQ